MRTLRVAVNLMPVFAGLLSLGGCRHEPFGDPGDDSGTANRLKVVSLVKPTVRTVRQTTTQPAIVHAWQQAEIYAKVSGYLQDLKADIGHELKQGETLAVIAIPEIQKARSTQAAEIKRLRAVEQRHEVEKTLAIANRQAAVADHEQSDALVQQANAQLVADTKALERVKKLVADKSVAARLLDEAEKTFVAANAALTATIAARSSAKSQIAVAAARIKFAEADAKAAIAQTNVAIKKLDEMEVLMKYATLTAPFAGIVTERNVDVGDLVQNIQTASENPRQPLFIIADLQKVRVHVMVPENDARLVTVGADCSLRLPSLSGRPISGKVTRMANKLDKQTLTMLVEIVLDNKRQDNNWMMLPGAYGEATITLKQKEEAVVLPAEAVHFDEKGNSAVYIIDSDDTVRIVPVTTGVDFGDEIEITNGLNPGDRVVGALIGRLKNGQKVRVHNR